MKHNQKWAKWIAQNPWQAFIVLLLIIWSFNQLLPLFWMFAQSFKTDAAITNYPLSLPKWPLYLENYPNAWFGKSSGITLNKFFLNSVMVVFSGLLILSVLATLAGYAFGRFKFFGRNFLFIFMVALIAIPIHALIIPIYKLMDSLHLINNLVGVILLNVTASLPFSVLILSAYFATFPKDLEDAAQMDGCTRLDVLWRVVIPVAKGAISAVAIVNFINMWNEVLLTLIVVWKNKFFTITVGILGYFQFFDATAWGLIYAGLSIVVIPLIIFYLIFHENIMKGSTLGSYM